jgi:hypothetical protein
VGHATPAQDPAPSFLNIKNLLVHVLVPISSLTPIPPACHLQRSPAGSAKRSARPPLRHNARPLTLPGHSDVSPPPYLATPSSLATPCPSSVAPRVHWPKPPSMCSPRGARVDAHPGHLEAHRRAPCATAASSFIIRPSSRMTLSAEKACYKSMFLSVSDVSFKCRKCFM